MRLRFFLSNSTHDFAPNFDDLKKVAAGLLFRDSLELELEQENTCAIPEELLRGDAKVAIRTYCFELLPQNQKTALQNKLKFCVIKGDEKVVQLFKDTFPYFDQEIINKSTKTQIPTAAVRLDHNIQNSSTSTASHSRIERPTSTERHEPTLTREERLKIRKIIYDYHSKSWEGFFWNWICWGFFGQHYSQTLVALRALVGDDKTLMELNRPKILEAIQIESQYAKHRACLFNNPCSSSIQSGTDTVIYNLSTVFSR